MSKRNLRTYYFDRITCMLDQASKMPSYPAVRKHRYIFLCKARSKTREALKKILKEEHGIIVEDVKDEDLPF